MGNAQNCGGEWKQLSQEFNTSKSFPSECYYMKWSWLHRLRHCFKGSEKFKPYLYLFIVLGGMHCKNQRYVLTITSSIFWIENKPDIALKNEQPLVLIINAIKSVKKIIKCFSKMNQFMSNHSFFENVVLTVVPRSCIHFISLLAAGTAVKHHDFQKVALHQGKTIGFSQNIGHPGVNSPIFSTENVAFSLGFVPVHNLLYSFNSYRLNQPLRLDSWHFLMYDFGLTIFCTMNTNRELVQHTLSVKQ